MPIKDQCANCRFQDDENCTKLVPSFDGTSCDVYAKRINLIKDEKSQPDLTPTVEAVSDNQYNNYYEDEIEQPSDEDIHGWLKFFLIFFVGIGSVASLIMSFVTFEAADNFWLSASDIAFAIVYLATGILTLVAFHKRDTDAVFLAKTYVVLCFASNILALFGSEGEIGSDKMVSRMIRSIIWCLWFIFLCSSNQVQSLIPKSYRKTKTRDWIIIAIVIILPFFCIGLGIASEKKSHAQTETVALANLNLDNNQFTDGRIILTIPYGTDCDETIAEKTKLFVVSDAETGAEVTIVSDYDTDATKKNFNQYWRGWKADELDNIKYEVVKDDKKSTGEITVFYKLIRAELDNPVDWEFALVFHHASGKVCLVSGYSSSETNSPVAYIINNLKFL